MTQIAAMPQNAWYHPGTYLSGLSNITTTNVQSPRAPENPTLDKLQLTLTSLYAGRASAMQGLNSLDQRQNVRLKHLHTSGVMTSSAFGAAGKTALVAGGLSVLRNMSHLAQGEINLARASGNISSDLISGTLGGLAAGASAGLVVQGSSNAGRFMAGSLGTIAGAIGFVAADVLLDKTGLKGFISDKITSLLEGSRASSYLMSQQHAAPPYTQSAYGH